MKAHSALAMIVAGLAAMEAPLQAFGMNRGGGGGGGRVSRPSVSSRPQVSRPSPSYRPTTRPSMPSRPSTGGSRLPSTRPSIERPTTRPSIPTTRPSVPAKPDIGYRPSVPSTRPSIPSTRPSVPSTRPSIPTTRPGNDLGLRPSPRPSIPDRPTTLPAVPDRPTTLPAVPDRPTTLPAVPERPGTLPSRPAIPERPTVPDRPTTRPAKPELPDRPGTLPSRPDIGDRPTTLPSIRPGDGTRPSIPDPPGRPPRPPRPDWSGQWKDREQVFSRMNDQWSINNRVNVNNFVVNRNTQWNVINQRWNQVGWHRSWGTSAYFGWRGSVWGYRGHRCSEIWYRTGPFRYHNHFFHRHWWGSCWWRPRPIYYPRPWWWWRPVAWTSIGYFFGASLAPQPIVYDPGTTVIYEGDTIYINGESAGDAEEYRQETIELANPEVDEIPVPEPPEVAEGTETVEEDPNKPDGDWLPVGVWALTQQEQGDATMFFQLSIDKEGLVGGAYKNVMTGDEQPVVGQLDFESQRVAWHIGEVTDTVYETGLSNFENDVASVFVHFGEVQTQTWLMVRMPSPEMPPGTVKLPELEEE